MRRWKREWEVKQQYAAERNGRIRKKNVRGLRRYIDYTCVGAVAGGCVLLVHLMDASLQVAVALSVLTAAFVILALVFSEMTEYERMMLFIHELLDHGAAGGEGDTNESEEETG